MFLCGVCLLCLNCVFGTGPCLATAGPGSSCDICQKQAQWVWGGRESAALYYTHRTLPKLLGRTSSSSQLASSRRASSLPSSLDYFSWLCSTLAAYLSSAPHLSPLGHQQSAGPAAAGAVQSWIDILYLQEPIKSHGLSQLPLKNSRREANGVRRRKHPWPASAHHPS